jgi:hypothetical protein
MPLTHEESVLYMDVILITLELKLFPIGEYLW